MNRNRVIWGLVSLMVLVTVVLSFGGLDNSTESVRKLDPTPTPVIKDTRDLRKYGSVDYSVEAYPTTERFLANRRYDNQGWVSPAVNPETGGIGRNTEDPLPPSLPIDESPVIIVGEIVKAVAYLSNDKLGVYTEFTIRVSETLKTDKTPSKTVLADRDGGVVVYPGGQRVFYQDSQIRLPRLGNTYLFFLVRDESPNFKILTAYELKDGKVRQMELRQDADRLNERGEKAFLRIVNERIQQAIIK